MVHLPKNLPAWLFLLFIATLALGTDEFVISGILPELAADLDVSSGRAGLLVTAFALAFCFGAPVVAVLTDRKDRKLILITGLLVFAAANALMAVADVFATALALRVIAGLAAAAVSPTAMSIAGTNAPAGSEGRYLAVATAGLTVALFTGVPLGAWIGYAWGWKATFLAIAAIAILVAILSALLMPSSPGNEPTSIEERLAPIRDWHILSLVIAMLLCGAGGLTFYNYLGVTIQDQLGRSPSDVSFTLLLVGLVGIAAVFGGGALTDSCGPRAGRLVIIGGHAAALLALGIYLFAGGSFGTGFLVLVAVWSLFSWALSPAMQTSLMSVDPEHATLTAALGISGLYGGAGIGAAVGGPLIDAFGSASIPFAGFAFVAGAWLFAFRKEPSKAQRITVEPTADLA